MRKRAELAVSAVPAGFSNAHLVSMCSALVSSTTSASQLKHISIGPPREYMADGAQPQDVPFSDSCVAALSNVLTSLRSLALAVIHGLSSEQRSAVHAAAPSRLHREGPDEDCLRLSSESRCACKSMPILNFVCQSLASRRVEPSQIRSAKEVIC